MKFFLMTFEMTKGQSSISPIFEISKEKLTIYKYLIATTNASILNQQSSRELLFETFHFKT